MNANSPPQPVINVVTAYEDFATGKRAIATYSNLVLRLGHEFQFRANMWKFDVLQHPKLQDMAASDALEAEVIIISTHGEGDLPDGVKDWIRRWVGPKIKKPRALIALSDPPEVGVVTPGSIRAYLRQVAREGKMDFFARPGEPANHARLNAKSGSGRTARPAFSFEGILAQ